MDVHDTVPTAGCYSILSRVSDSQHHIHTAESRNYVMSKQHEVVSYPVRRYLGEHTQTITLVMAPTPIFFQSESEMAQSRRELRSKEPS